MIKRYAREEDGNIYDRLKRRCILIESERLIGNRYYLNPGTESELVISKDEIEE